MNISVRQLKDHLSEYLRRAESGEEIVITSRGRPVARLAPPVVQPEDAEAEAIARLRAAPWIRPGSGEKLQAPERRIPTPPGEPLISDLVMRDRE